MRARRLRLVPPAVSDETIRHLKLRLDEARDAGHPDRQLVGIAYIAIYRSRYTALAAGQALANPTLTRGMLKDLDDYLRTKRRTS